MYVIVDTQQYVLSIFPR